MLPLSELERCFGSIALQILPITSIPSLQKEESLANHNFSSYQPYIRRSSLEEARTW